LIKYFTHPTFADKGPLARQGQAHSTSEEWLDCAGEEAGDNS